MSGGGRGRPQPYYPSQGYQHWNQDYNFSSDVNLTNSNGSFQFGSPPPMQGYRRPFRGGGFRGGGFRGRGYPNWGFRGGYSPRPYGGFEQRGFRPQFYRGRYPRQGPLGSGMGNRGGGGYGRPGYGRGHYQGSHKQRRFDGDDPFYHPSMFEDPWRFLMPKRASDDQDKKSAKTEAPDADEDRNSDDADAMEVGDGVEDGGKSDERTGIPSASSVEEEVERVGDATAGVDVKGEEDGEGGMSASESLAGKVEGQGEVEASEREEQVVKKDESETEVEGN